MPTSYWSEIELNTGIMCASAATLRPLLRHVMPNLSRERHSYYPERKGSKGSDGDQSGENRAIDEASVPDVYALRDCSEDGLRDNAAYEAAPHARHPGPTAELRTAIYGGSNEVGQSKESVGVAREIRVTRETMVRESRGAGKREEDWTAA